MFGGFIQVGTAMNRTTCFHLDNPRTTGEGGREPRWAQHTLTAVTVVAAIMDVYTCA